jgi:HD superfamily phosphohydrolase
MVSQKSARRFRLVALLHDVGHSPFSHASEDVFSPIGQGQGIGDLLFKDMEVKRYKHEDGLIINELREAIEGHSSEKNYDLKAEDIAKRLNAILAPNRRSLWP